MQQDDTTAADFGQGLARFLQAFLAGLPGARELPLEELARALAVQPERVAQLQERFAQAHARLWADARAAAPRVPRAGHADRRFESADWDEVPFFRLVRDTYLLNAQWLEELIALADLPVEQARRLRFVARQALDALAPTNFPWTNPEALRLAARTGGASVEDGLRNLTADLAQGHISRSANGAFAVGRNLAITPGAVVHETPIAQLIQYRPRTPLVRARPLLIVPPFINRYYILDLQPEDSFVRFALDQGLQVFLVSWRNPGMAQARCGWDDYVRQGVLEMLDAVLDICASPRLNVLGFCVGGTLLATALAVMQRPARVASLTLLASLLDFAEPGEIGVYVDRDYVERCERAFARGGLVPGAQIAAAFASLRSNELVWHFVVNNYLKGRTPPAFDLLAWNADSANLPGPLYAWYLRNLYLENRLREPGRARVLGKGVDLRRLRMPAYVMAAREDHIVPWTSAYASSRLLAGRIDFVLGASGHVAGVVNPPAHGRRHYWAGGSAMGDAQAWLSEAVRHEGSWWSHWAKWIQARSGRSAAAPLALGNARHGIVEPAPGRYVREPCAPAETIKP
jgi:polyhydroxyalkanoate synthase